MSKQMEYFDKETALVFGLNIFIVMAEIAGFIMRIIIQHDPGFLFYTMDSNLLSLAASIVLIYYIFKNREFPRWLSVLRLASIIALLVTFIIVITVLSPGMENGYITMMFSGQMIFTHTLCPIVATTSFLLFERHKLVNKDVAYALIYTVTYAAVLLTLNTLNIVRGPYPFLYVHEQSILATIAWSIGILGGAYIVGALAKKLRRHQ